MRVLQHNVAPHCRARLSHCGLHRWRGADIGSKCAWVCSFVDVDDGAQALSHLSPSNGIAAGARLAVYDFKAADSDDLLIPDAFYNEFLLDASVPSIALSLCWCWCWCLPACLHDISVYGVDGCVRRYGVVVGCCSVVGSGR